MSVITVPIITDETGRAIVEAIKKIPGGGGGGGTSDYEALDNKPQVNGVELIGDKTLAELGIASESALNDLATLVGSVNAELEGV